MLIDRSHRPWFAFSLAVVAGGGLWYAAYARSAPNGPSGASVPGLTFGVASAACLLFAAGLGMRRRFRSRRLGRAQTWLRGHLWLGTICVPLAWYHGGFRHGGPVTAATMWLLYVVVVSGFVGLLLQQLMPRWLTTDVPNETTYGQIPATLAANRAEAERVVARYAAAAAYAARDDGGGGGGRGGTAVAEQVAVAGPMDAFYAKAVRPYLAARPSPAADRRLADALSDARRAQPATALPVLDQLEAICRDSRNLYGQRRIHRLLHGWLFVHAPLSMALVVLVVVHGVMALRWAW